MDCFEILAKIQSLNTWFFTEGASIRRLTPEGDSQCFISCLINETIEYWDEARKDCGIDFATADKFVKLADGRCALGAFEKTVLNACGLGDF